MPSIFQERNQHTFVARLNFSRGEEQSPWHFIQLGILKPFFPGKGKARRLALPQ